MNQKPKAFSKKQNGIKHKKGFPKSSIIILVIIINAIIIAVTAFLIPIFVNTQNSVQSTIESLARNYYENYLYENLNTVRTTSDSAAFEETMQKYQEYGFGTVHLRQILQYNKQENHTPSIDVADYCDENETVIKFYPEPPYNRTTYRMELTYSCNF